MAEDRIRYGMLGTGMIADWLAKGFAGCAHSELAAVASRSAGTAESFAASHQVPKHYGSYEALLADPALQAVIVALPNSLHTEWTVRAAEAGKHVLCEKPLAMTPVDCDRMAKACHRAGVQLMEAAMYRFQPQIAKVLEWIAAGRIGRVRLIRGTFCFPFKDLANIRLKPEMGGGCLFDLGFYPVDFALCMAGEMPSQVCCFAVYGAQSKVEEVAAGCLHFPSGAAALFECGFAVDIRTTAEIIGELGSIQLPDPWTARGKTKEVLLLKARAVIEKAELPDPNAYTLEIDHFSECILRGQAPLRTLAATRATAAVLDALARSAREGLSVGVA